jgi:S-adenosylmethionine:tRNA ribosyltransferase-isomerase
MRRSEFHFDLPSELVAQRPPEERDGARLLVVDAQSGAWRHSRIRDLPGWVPDGALCVPNDVKVRHARLVLRRAGGGGGEALLHRGLGGGRFEALLRPGGRLKAGKAADILDPASGAALARLTVEKDLGGGAMAVRLSGDAPLDWDRIDSFGLLPLPPYIKRPADDADDERYQTVFRAEGGEAVAAPTAGLHFTPGIIDRLKKKNCLWLPIRLHVGPGTFRPMTADDIEEHAMHEEMFEIPEGAAAALAETLAQGPGASRDVLAIGTTSLRALEAAFGGRGRPAGGEAAPAATKINGATSIFIRPGHKISTADHLLTNFHLPESTLFVLVSAILGLELAKSAYMEAIREKYRFFSYGDAMLIQNVRRAGAPP